MFTRDEIAYKVANDINYIPDISELKILGDDFSIGRSPIFSLKIQDSYQSRYDDLLEKSSFDPIIGCGELFSQLREGKCTTYKEDRLFFVAYELSKFNILFDLDGFEYRNKLNEKLSIIQNLLSKSKE